MSVVIRLTLTVPSEVRSVGVGAGIVRAIVDRADTADRCVAAYVELAVSEGLANAIVHGHDRDARRPLRVEIECADDTFTALVHDEGPGFTLATVALPADPLAEGGRGIFLMRELMDEVEYRRGPAAGNVLRLVKRLT